MPRHASLVRDPANFIANRWLPIPGDAIVSRNPARPAELIFSSAAEPTHVDPAVAAARAALPHWSRLPIERRAAVLTRFAALAKAKSQLVADILCDEIGKAMWECKQEAGLLANKVDITLDTAPNSGRSRITPYALEISPTRQGRCLFRPHGVMAVLGPFNFPAHLPNGHIVPALLAGNTIIFKPSDKAPATGQVLTELFAEALAAEGITTPGIINLVQGGAEIARKLVAHEGVDAVAFTGSWPVGRAILQANLDRPGRIVALEMGGNNPAIVMPDADLRQAAIEVTRCAFNTTGQRCTSTRRLIVHESIAPKFIAAVAKAASNLIIGDPRAKHPVFAGPIISAPMRQAVLDAQRQWAASGAETIVPASTLDVPNCPNGYFITPGISRVDRFTTASDTAPGADTEIFGPLLRVAVVSSLDAAIEQANATRFGLAASIFTKDSSAIEHFLHEARAGCLNVNTGTAGASSKLPFGGLGHSGNHRPAGAFALDYCAYPVASMVESTSTALIADGMRFEDTWLS